MSRLPTWDVVTGCKWQLSGICTRGFLAHADVLKIPRDANRVGAIFNHSICRYGLYESDGTWYVNRANGDTHNAAILADHLFQNLTFLSMKLFIYLGPKFIRCLPKDFLYSLIFMLMTGVVIYSPGPSYFTVYINIRLFGSSSHTTSSAIWKVKNCTSALASAVVLSPPTTVGVDKNNNHHIFYSSYKKFEIVCPANSWKASRAGIPASDVSAITL